MQVIGFRSSPSDLVVLSLETLKIDSKDVVSGQKIHGPKRTLLNLPSNVIGDLESPGLHEAGCRLYPLAPTLVHGYHFRKVSVEAAAENEMVQQCSQRIS